jgi:hypothetical protein
MSILETSPTRIDHLVQNGAVYECQHCEAPIGITDEMALKR